MCPKDAEGMAKTRQDPDQSPDLLVKNFKVFIMVAKSLKIGLAALD